MRIISKKKLNEFSKRHSDAKTSLDSWHEYVKKTTWVNLQEVREVYSHADAVEVKSRRTVTVFNIGGGKYRLLAAMHYNRNVVYILDVMTHAEYDKGKWKETL